ncbi:MAG: hypothetical protein KME25_16160 [Symplocastrum torsivum CPER-KK1]|jgi:hypothetical protein|uniref:Uncharacterized protein n=1 Tax=Symplocastrum torsivum CPER-KK1 TaxID=450513 RepID=A0A951PLS3_9CYAN|nr:hypothetical protein [Symplocastrum torsivum CPER-KK1]
MLSILTVFIPQLALAQTPLAPKPASEPLELELLELDAPPPGRDLITANTISATEVAIPSLWWAKEQFNVVGGKLINNWIAYQDEKRIDMVVNAQLWTLLDYLGRYRFVNNFGTVARDYEYDVRVFNQQGERLATYTCNYTPELPVCELEVVASFGQDSLSVPRQ